LRNKIIVALENEIVTCPNGHEICEINYDLLQGDIVRETGFKNWRENQEVFESEECKCSICHEFWFISGRIHIKNIGWK